ncbi:unnamed protein product [Ilex paraguariensis]|uniref:Nuclear pore complex protein n=1 Tax=Ilex paraguariensis TaxID=185542 RepID=A0ABC8UIX9_9AQUA
MTSSKECTDIKDESKKENLTSSPFGGTSFAMPSTGSGIFGLNSSVTSSTANNQSQGSLSGTGNGAMVSAQSAATRSGVATVSQSMSVQFGSSSSLPITGTSGISSFNSSSSLLGSAVPAAKLFGSGSSFSLSSSASSSEMNQVNSTNGPTSSIFSFGVSSSASISGTNSVSSDSGAPCIFGSGWQPTQSPIFTSTFNTLSPSTGFSFGASSASVAASNNAPLVFGSSTGATSPAIFSFTNASAMTLSSPSLSQTQPVFGNSNSVFTAFSANGDQTNMEDSMAEDPVQASTPVVSIFGQPPILSPPAGFGVFGSTAPSPAIPFQFGGQQNQAAPQNSSPFQATSSLEFSAGESFSLGSGGGDKSSRRPLVDEKITYLPRD